MLIRYILSRNAIWLVFCTFAHDFVSMTSMCNLLFSLYIPCPAGIFKIKRQIVY